MNCENKISEHLENEIEIFQTYMDDQDIMEEGNDELSPFHEYGLDFGYVEPRTFEDQHEGYFRYQLSYGGPSDEFRYYVNPDGSVHRIEYWFLDWFDGASITLSGPDYDLMDQVFDWITDGDITHWIN